MTVQELIDALTKTVELVPEFAKAQVSYGDDREVVEGGLAGQVEGSPHMNLAPLKLNNIPGGF